MAQACSWREGSGPALGRLEPWQATPGLHPLPRGLAVPSQRHLNPHFQAEGNKKAVRPRIWGMGCQEDWAPRRVFQP